MHIPETVPHAEYMYPIVSRIGNQSRSLQDTCVYLDAKCISRTKKSLQKAPS